MPSTGLKKRPWLSASPQNIVIFIAGIVGLIAVAAVVVVAGAGKSFNPNAVTSVGPVDTTSDAQRLQDTVASLSRFVEAARGLKFVTPVKATLYTDAEFDSHLRALGAARLDANTLGNIATLKALGVIPADYDPAKTPLDTSGVLGYYDPKTKELAVRGAYTSIYVRKTLVHELTHALQDQKFDLRRVMSGGSDANGGKSVPQDQDQILAEQALVEGDARRTENSWTSTLSIDEQNLLERQARAKGDEEFPTGFLLGYQSFPYVVGATFTGNLVRAGGQGQLDKAFANPPVSTKQVIQVSSYLSGEGPLPVQPPAADGPVVDRGALGEFTLIYVLAHRMSVHDAVVLSSGWGGDSFVTWNNGPTPCTRFKLGTVGPVGSGGMLVALRAWAAAAPKRTVTGYNPITVTACA